ncbi:MAG: deoxyuridine 5'-triphosphate nucleotidohydrolase, partial [Lachnospiraceae bacterium]|nr:deoxyuridine 5'-triphosphate nucleotidohydrolase [Lachnospiraceae bacterium]
MERIASFMKVSKDNFVSAITDEFKDIDAVKASEIYDNLKLPVRGTAGSAGYDFKIPVNLTLKPGETAKIPTGIRSRMENGWVLMVFPRSGLGFKYRLQ